MNNQETRKVSLEAFDVFLKALNIEKADFRGRIIYKFETENLPALLAGLSECHDKLYRILLTTHIANIPKDKRVEAIKDLREFTNNYLDLATNELTEAASNNEMISTCFGVVE